VGSLDIEMSFSRQAKINSIQCLQFPSRDCLIVIEQLALASQVPADPFFDHVLGLLEVMAGFLAIGPQVLERLPLPVALIVKPAASVIIMRSGHCDSLELGLQVFKETLKEDLKSMRFPQVKPGCLWGAHGDWFHAVCSFLILFGAGPGLKKSGMQNSRAYQWQNE
jgi:hypothetical protein